MNLIKFAAQKGAKFIKADDLDKNFAMLQPKDNGTYSINESAEGWDLSIFPKYPKSMKTLHFLVYNPQKIQNSDRDIKGLQWITRFFLNAVDFLLSYKNDNTTPEPQGAVLVATGNGRVQWTESAAPPLPPSGTAEWRQVERCDGKRMYVWGTDWSTS